MDSLKRLKATNFEDHMRYRERWQLKWPIPDENKRKMINAERERERTEKTRKEKMKRLKGEPE